METKLGDLRTYTCKEAEIRFNPARGRGNRGGRSSHGFKDLRTDDTLASRGLRSNPISPIEKRRIGAVRLSGFSSGKKNADVSSDLLAKRDFRAFSRDGVHEDRRGGRDLGDQNEGSERSNSGPESISLRSHPSREINSENSEPSFEDFQTFYTKWALGEKLEAEDLKLNKKTEYLLRKIIETQGYYVCGQKDFGDIKFYRKLRERTFKKSKEEKCKYAIKLSHKFLKSWYDDKFGSYRRERLDSKLGYEVEQKDIFYYYYFFEHWEKMKAGEKKSNKKKTILDGFFEAKNGKGGKENQMGGNSGKKGKTLSKFRNIGFRGDIFE